MYIRVLSTSRKLESQDGESGLNTTTIISVMIAALLFVCVLCIVVYRWRRSASECKSVTDTNAQSKTYTDIHSCFPSPENTSPGTASGSFHKQTSESCKQKSSAFPEEYTTYRFATVQSGSHSTDFNGASPCPILGPRLSAIDNTSSMNVMIEKPSNGTEILEMDTIDPHPRISSACQLSINSTKLKSQPQFNVAEMLDTTVTTANFIDTESSNAEPPIVYRSDQFKDYIQANRLNSDTFDANSLESSSINFGSSKRNFLVSSQLSSRGSVISYEELCSSRVQTVQVAL
ncbi:unnamed protein product [Albugo candida]|uniref:Uncharacterized protein n=1 Tax=Albugo candida TaxID=65357 RepID=A0A024G2M1_9STRA|nr:unnamed protein product [Albugo candida]|eukprot:CCI41015.1 unnamed protein product [Albugo candida]